MRPGGYRGRAGAIPGESRASGLDYAVTNIKIILTSRAFYIIVVKQQAISFYALSEADRLCILIHIIIFSLPARAAFSFYPSQKEADKYASLPRPARLKDFIQAADYWLKVIEIAEPENPGLSLARQRLETIGEIIPSVKQRFLREESARLSRETRQFKQAGEPAQFRVERAKEFSKNKDYTNALKMLLDAKQSDPGNEELDKLLQSAMAKLFP